MARQVPLSGKRDLAEDWPSSWRTMPIRSSASPRSRMVKDSDRPMRSAQSRSRRAPMAWKVPAQGRPAAAAPHAGASPGAAPRPRGAPFPRRRARRSTTACAGDRRRSGSDGPRGGQAYWSCPNRRRRSPAAGRPRRRPCPARAGATPNSTAARWAGLRSARGSGRSCGADEDGDCVSDMGGEWQQSHARPRPGRRDRPGRAQARQLFIYPAIITRCPLRHGALARSA